MNRRTLFTGTATLATVLFGGCTGVPDESREGVTLTHVELGNASGEPQVFDLLGTNDDEITHWSSHEVGIGASGQEMGAENVDIDAPDERGHARLLSELARRGNGLTLPQTDTTASTLLQWSSTEWSKTSCCVSVGGSDRPTNDD